MAVRRMAGGVLLGLGSATVAILCLAGPLFPWSPIRPGYGVERMGRATVIQPRGAPVSIGDAEGLMAELEARTGLRYRSPVTVVVARDWRLFNRGGLLRMNTSPVPVLGSALQTGTVVYLSPLVREPGRDPAAVLRHELVHALLFQQMPLRRTFALVRLDWFEEGLAVHLGNPGDYLDDGEWARAARHSGYRFDPALPLRPPGLPAQTWGPFRLTEYRQLTAFLMRRCGRHAAYRDAVLADPDRYSEAYARACGEPFSSALAAFGTAVRDGRWPVNGGVDRPDSTNGGG